MRIFAILSLLILVSCASPQKNPESYYAGTYTPSNLNIENGEFVAYASVVEEKNIELAEKAAYLRLMNGAKAQGYRYFKVINAGKTTFIGSRYTVKGKLYKSHRNGAGVYSLDAISRLLRGLPIEEKYIAPKPVKKIVIAKPKKVARKVVKRVSAPAPTPAPVVVDGDGPTVIMAPEDITGSVKKVIPMAKIEPMPTATLDNLNSVVELPNAVSEIPKGVLLRKR